MPAIKLAAARVGLLPDPGLAPTISSDVIEARNPCLHGRIQQ